MLALLYLQMLCNIVSGSEETKQAEIDWFLDLPFDLKYDQSPVLPQYEENYLIVKNSLKNICSYTVGEDKFDISQFDLKKKILKAVAKSNLKIEKKEFVIDKLESMFKDKAKELDLVPYFQILNEILGANNMTVSDILYLTKKFVSDELETYSKELITNLNNSELSSNKDKLVEKAAIEKANKFLKNIESFLTKISNIDENFCSKNEKTSDIVNEINNFLKIFSEKYLIYNFFSDGTKLTIISSLRIVRTILSLNTAFESVNSFSSKFFGIFNFGLFNKYRYVQELLLNLCIDSILYLSGNNQEFLNNLSNNINSKNINDWVEFKFNLLFDFNNILNVNKDNFISKINEFCANYDNINYDNITDKKELQAYEAKLEITISILNKFKEKTGSENKLKIEELINKFDGYKNNILKCKENFNSNNITEKTGNQNIKKEENLNLVGATNSNNAKNVDVAHNAIIQDAISIKNALQEDNLLKNLNLVTSPVDNKTDSLKKNLIKNQDNSVFDKNNKTIISSSNVGDDINKAEDKKDINLNQANATNEKVDSQAPHVGVNGKRISSSNDKSATGKNDSALLNNQTPPASAQSQGSKKIINSAVQPVVTTDKHLSSTASDNLNNQEQDNNNIKVDDTNSNDRKEPKQGLSDLMIVVILICLILTIPLFLKILI